MFLGGGLGLPKGKQTSGRPPSRQGDFRPPLRNETSPRPRAAWRPSGRAAGVDPLREVSLEGSDTQLRPLLGERKSGSVLTVPQPPGCSPTALPRAAEGARVTTAVSTLLWVHPMAKARRAAPKAARAPTSLPRRIYPCQESGSEWYLQTGNISFSH